MSQFADDTTLQLIDDQSIVEIFRIFNKYEQASGAKINLSKCKGPLVNRDILALPLKEGGFNIGRLDSKIQALRLNTLRRMLTGEGAHWKHFTAYFLRVSGMSLGKLTLALDYKPQDIDNDINPFTRNF